MEEPTPKRRPRISLLSLLLLMTVVALALGLFLGERRNSRLRDRLATLESERRAYRTRLGVLDVNDPTKIHAIREIAPKWDAYRYRVYLPEGREYVVRYHGKRAKPDRYAPEGFFRIGNGIQLIEVGYEYPVKRSTGTTTPVVRISQPHLGDNAVGEALPGMLRRTLNFPEDWLLPPGELERGAKSRGWYGVGGVYSEQETHDADESLRLHLRQAINDKSMAHGGLEVWIEPAPVAEPVPPPPAP